MYSQTKTNQSTETSSTIDQLKKKLEECDAVLIGAGAGLSTSAGFTYSGKRFKDNFADFEDQFGFHDMYSGGFYPFPEPEIKWAYWSRMINLNRYSEIPNNVFSNLLTLVKDKDYFVITTNVDHCFQKSGFDKNRLFYTQGDYGLFQCSLPCCRKTFDNEEMIRNMVSTQKNMRIPSDLVPKCPKCGKEMTTNLRCDSRFVEDIGWSRANNRYEEFLFRNRHSKILYLELGVGFNTPGIIKYPFWQLTFSNPDSTFATINKGEAFSPKEIADRSICIDGDIGKVVEELL